MGMKARYTVPHLLDCAGQWTGASAGAVVAIHGVLLAACASIVLIASKKPLKLHFKMMVQISAKGMRPET